MSLGAHLPHSVGRVAAEGLPVEDFKNSELPGEGLYHMEPGLFLAGAVAVEEDRGCTRHYLWRS